MAQPTIVGKRIPDEPPDARLSAPASSTCIARAHQPRPCVHRAVVNQSSRECAPARALPRTIAQAPIVRRARRRGEAIIADRRSRARSGKDSAGAVGSNRNRANAAALTNRSSSTQIEKMELLPGRRPRPRLPIARACIHCRSRLRHGLAEIRVLITSTIIQREPVVQARIAEAGGPTSRQTVRRTATAPSRSHQSPADSAFDTQASRQPRRAR